MPGVRAVVETLDEVPEGLREHYTEADGKYRLNVDGAQPEDVQGLKSALEKERKAAKEAADRLKAFDGVDPEEFQRLKAEAEKAAEARAKESGDFEALKKGHEEKVRRVTEEKEAVIAKQRDFIHRLVVENELTAALNEVNVGKDYMEGALALMQSKAPRVIEDGEDYQGVFEVNGAATPIRDFVAQWAKSDKGAAYIAASGTNGTGSRQSDGGPGGGDATNPWSKAGWNRTEQARIAADDPDRARRMKASAGA